MTAKNIMIQGTASSVGKSILTAGLCRLLSREGYKVAPFKAQNIALNSYVTQDGKEIGRAQAVQAEACGQLPSYLMNPILLKITSSTKMQVILNGEVYGNFTGKEYYALKEKMKNEIRKAYEELSKNNDIIVIEGAGSPAEINMQENNFVNMGTAKMANAPVILVGDIDKGGVFASLAGTIMLLEPGERDRVKGLVINKFRGDLEILRPGLGKLENITQKPVLGVLPYVNLSIDDEDSAVEKLEKKTHKNVDGGLDIAVIKLPHISNFTDLNALEQLEGNCVRYIDSVSDLGDPDAIILPGSKNTVEDFIYLRHTGLESRIIELGKKGTIIFGICGGYQMLGKTIEDPAGVESGISCINGFGLLNVKTVFMPDKTTTQNRGRISSNKGLLEGLRDFNVTGYEIHMGTTELMDDCEPFLISDEGNVTGVVDSSGTFYGTYFHGIFDNEEFTIGFLNNLRKKKGIKPIINRRLGTRIERDFQYDLLADTIKNNLDMTLLYKIIGV